MMKSIDFIRLLIFFIYKKEELKVEDQLTQLLIKLEKGPLLKLSKEQNYFITSLIIFCLIKISPIK